MRPLDLDDIAEGRQDQEGGQLFVKIGVRAWSFLPEQDREGCKLAPLKARTRMTSLLCGERCVRGRALLLDNFSSSLEPIWPKSRNPT